MRGGREGLAPLQSRPRCGRAARALGVKPTRTAGCRRERVARLGSMLRLARSRSGRDQALGVRQDEPAAGGLGVGHWRRCESPAAWARKLIIP